MPILKTFIGTGLEHISMKKSILVLALIIGVGGASVALLGRSVELAPVTASVTAAPTPEQAKAIFTTLHKNIYSAFDFKTESDIYDALSKSVAGSLLDKVYNEIYQSLVIASEGGSVSKVEAVKILSSSLLKQTDDTDFKFRIKAQWQVNSSIWHLTHSHNRTNQYEGIYTIGLVDGNWRILDDQVLRERRVAEEWAPFNQDGTLRQGNSDPNPN